MSFDPERKSSGSSIAVIIVVVLGVCGLLVCGVCGAGFFYARTAAIKFGDEFQKQFNAQIQMQSAKFLAEQSIQADEALKAELGENIVTGEIIPSIPNGEVDVNNAKFSFTVTGNEKTGTAECESHQVEGNWKLKKIEVNLNGKVFSVKPIDNAAPTLDFPTEKPEEEKEMKKEE